jgi:hypothetical protein
VMPSLPTKLGLIDFARPREDQVRKYLGLHKESVCPSEQLKQ